MGAGLANLVISAGERSSDHKCLVGRTLSLRTLSTLPLSPLRKALPCLSEPHPKTSAGDVGGGVAVRLCRSSGALRLQGPWQGCAYVNSTQVHIHAGLHHSLHLRIKISFHTKPGERTRAGIQYANTFTQSRSPSAPPPPPIKPLAKIQAKETRGREGKDASAVFLILCLKGLN